MLKFFVFLNSLIFLLSQNNIQLKQYRSEHFSRKKNTLVDKKGILRANFRLNYSVTGKNVEEKARNYLKEKISKNLIQNSNRRASKV